MDAINQAAGVATHRRLTVRQRPNYRPISIVNGLVDDCRLKTNLEAAEERCEELQRLLDTSRSAEAQSRAHLRAMQKLQQKQQQQQQEQEEQQLEQEEQAFESMEMQQDDCLMGGRPESELAMCRRLIEDMVQVEDRLQQLETEWFQEKSTHYKNTNQLNAIYRREM